MDKRTEYVGPNIFVRIFSGILLIQALAGFVFILHHWWTGADRTITPGGVAMCVFTLVLAGAAANGLRSRVAISEDTIEIRSAFYTRRLKRSEITGTRTVYAGRWRGRELWVYDSQGQYTPIPNIVKRRLTDDNWVAGLDDLTQVQIKRNSDSFASDERLGTSEGERRWNGSAWQGRTNFLNLASFMILFMTLIVPDDLAYVRWPLVLAAIAMPLLAVGITYFTYGAVDLIHRERDEGPNLQVLSGAPLVLLWLSFDVHGGHWGTAWTIGFCLAIPVTYWLTRLMRAAGHSLEFRGPATFLVVAMYFASSILLLRDHREQLRSQREVPTTSTTSRTPP
jgi:hypothetical protein